MTRLHDVRLFWKHNWNHIPPPCAAGSLWHFQSCAKVLTTNAITNVSIYGNLHNADN